MTAVSSCPFPDGQMPIWCGVPCPTGAVVVLNVPWRMFTAAAEEQLRRNSGQTLRRLAERGGLDVWEAICMLAGMPYRRFCGFAKNPQRMGPLTMAARRHGLAEVLDVQATCNEAAAALGRPLVDLLNAAECARILDLIEAGTWPDGWIGDEPVADRPLDSVFADGTVQPLLAGVFS